MRYTHNTNCFYISLYKSAQWVTEDWAWRVWCMKIYAQEPTTRPENMEADIWMTESTVEKKSMHEDVNLSWKFHGWTFNKKRTVQVLREQSLQELFIGRMDKVKYHKAWFGKITMQIMPTIIMKWQIYKRVKAKEYSVHKLSTRIRHIRIIPSLD